MRWLVRLLLTLPVAHALLINSAGAQSPDHEFLRRLKEQEWPRAYREQDTALLGRILAADFRRVNSAGAWTTRDDELEYIRTHKPAYDSLVFRIRRLDVFPNGTAIVGGTGYVFERGRVTEYQSTNVLLKREGRWRAVASHTSGDRPAAVP